MLIVRKYTYLQFTGVVIAILISFYMEFYLLIEPCLLCFVQRIIMLMLLICIACQLIFKSFQFTFEGMSIIILLLGLVLSIHHFNLSINLDPDSQCLPDLSYLISTFGIWETVSMVIYNPASCSKVQSYFLGLNLPVWLIIFYIAQLILSTLKLCAVYNRSRPK